MFKSIFGKYFTAFTVVLLVSFVILIILIAGVAGTYTSNVEQEVIDKASFGAADYLDDYAVSGSALQSTPLFEEGKLNADATRLLQSLADMGDDVTLLVTDNAGNVLCFASRDGVQYTKAKIPADVLNDLRAGKRVERLPALDGVFDKTQRCGVSFICAENGAKCGMVIACSPFVPQGTLISAMVRTVIVVSVFVLLAALIAVYVTSARIIGPLKNMRRMARAFAAGDFSARAPVVGRDEVAELAIAFNQMAGALSQLEVMRGTFIANVSHDLRTPMTTISGFIDNILSGAIPPDKHGHYLEMIRTEVQRLARLVSSLLDISRIQAGDRKFEMKPFDICEMGRLILFSFEQKIETKHLDVEFFCDSDRIAVEADHDAIYQIFYNICDNAVKFSKEDGVLRVRIHRNAEGKVCVSVYNEGAGIAAADLPFVFERFYKSDKSRGLDKSGVGLGMFIAKAIMDAHGEPIWVESIEGEYCEFKFTLPSAELPVPHGGKVAEKARA